MARRRLLLAALLLPAVIFISAACNKSSDSSATASATPAASVETAQETIESKARVFELDYPGGLIVNVGVMGAYEPKSHAFWWRAVQFIAEPGSLERYFERCRFLRDANLLLAICVRNNEVVIASSGDRAQSLDEGLDDAVANVKRNPNLVMSYRGPRDSGFNLQQRAGVDMNTGEGVAPTSVRSVHKTATGWELDVSCGCGDARITLNNNFDFVELKRE